MDIRLPGGHTLGIQGFTRFRTSRAWATVGPVYDTDDRTLGIAASLGRAGLALYVMPADWSTLALDED
jgi:hypothetical protein